MNTGRDDHTATLLTSGQVLVSGGLDENTVTSISSAELYYPASGTWTNTGSMNIVRTWHKATLLPNGQVLVSGGKNDFTGVAQSSAELYDPIYATWTYTGSMNNARFDHTATLLPNGQVLVAGGYGSSGVNSSAELYGSAINATLKITSIVRMNAGDLLITWNTTGTSNIVQVTQNLGTGFSNLASFVITTSTTNYLDVGVVTNKPARFYRIWSPQ
jgi:hypothetical protein